MTWSGESWNQRVSANAPNVIDSGRTQFDREHCELASLPAAAIMVPTAAATADAITARALGLVFPASTIYVNQTTSAADGKVTASTAAMAPAIPRKYHPVAAQNASILVPGVILANPNAMLN